MNEYIGGLIIAVGVIACAYGSTPNPEMILNAPPTEHFEKCAFDPTEFNDPIAEYLAMEKQCELIIFIDPIPKEDA